MLKESDAAYHIPDTLYKYRSLAGDNKERVKKIFIDDEIYLPNPTQFNDPFDCKVDLLFEGTEEEWKEYSKKLVEAQNIPPGKRIIIQRRLSRGSQLRKVDFSQILARRTKSLGIYSLSSEPDDILMWSHYADSHRGICIGFDTGPMDEYDTGLFKVAYLDKFPTTRIMDDSYERMKSTLLTKSHRWEYEQEYRFLDLRGTGKRKLPLGSITSINSVIIGSETIDEDRADVLNWVKNHSNNPTVFEATKEDREFSLKITKINP